MQTCLAQIEKNKPSARIEPATFLHVEPETHFVHDSLFILLSVSFAEIIFWNNFDIIT